MESNAKGNPWAKNDPLLLLIPYLGGLRAIVRQVQFGGPGVSLRAQHYFREQADLQIIREASHFHHRHVSFPFRLFGLLTPAGLPNNPEAEAEDMAGMDMVEAVWSFAYMTTQTMKCMESEQKITAADKEKIEKAVKETLEYFELALQPQYRKTKEQLVAKQKELEGVVNPIMYLAIQTMRTMHSRGW
jgi:hypothetical protein